MRMTNCAYIKESIVRYVLNDGDISKKVIFLTNMSETFDLSIEKVFNVLSHSYDEIVASLDFMLLMKKWV